MFSKLNLVYRMLFNRIGLKLNLWAFNISFLARKTKLPSLIYHLNFVIAYTEMQNDASEMRISVRPWGVWLNDCFFNVLKWLRFQEGRAFQINFEKTPAKRKEKNLSHLLTPIFHMAEFVDLGGSKSQIFILEFCVIFWKLSAPTKVYAWSYLMIDVCLTEKGVREEY